MTLILLYETLRERYRYANVIRNLKMNKSGVVGIQAIDWMLSEGKAA